MLATPTGLEPATSAVTGRRANQLRHGALMRPRLYRTAASAAKADQRWSEDPFDKLKGQRLRPGIGR